VYRFLERRIFIMWKKALPIIGLSGILLVGCNNNGDVQNNNETPMQDVHENENSGNNEGNNGNNGTTTNGLGTNQNENDNNSQVEIIEDLNRINDVQE
jgi:hypothetical protein